MLVPRQMVKAFDSTLPSKRSSQTNKTVLILLQKTLLNIEGVGRQLYPDLDLWTTAAPFLERWLKKKVGLKQ